MRVCSTGTRYIRSIEMELFVGVLLILLVAVIWLARRSKNSDNRAKENRELKQDSKDEAKKAREIIMNSGNQKSIEFLELLDKVNEHRKESKMKGASGGKILGGAVGGIAIVELFTIVQQDLEEELNSIDNIASSSDANFANPGSSGSVDDFHHIDDFSDDF